MKVKELVSILTNPDIVDPECDVRFGVGESEFKLNKIFRTYKLTSTCNSDINSLHTRNSIYFELGGWPVVNRGDGEVIYNES